ncbi:MAG: 4Fe-4S cluster-binding domain-containing protein [Candidatus Bipolaricaulota bacterium]|nr:MAG: 4Fe-4S cluster-binding domain-containing protein [Candidatus Bipolaricaulota bacterium]
MDEQASYLALVQDELSRRAEVLAGWVSPCRLCRRACGAHRDRGETGFCGIGATVRVASYGPHFGEEPELVGRYGSGTIFFSGCNLACVYCQNSEISWGRQGWEIGADALAGVMLALQDSGCHNINLVTPTHVASGIVDALLIARDGGLRLPLVWNCGGYESVDVLRQLDGIVDIYMPDLKYGTNDAACRLSDAPDYVAVSREAVREMHRQVGDLVVADGVAVRGLLLRHLVLPERLAASREVLRFVAEEISRDSYVNIMAQYRPMHRAEEFPELARRVHAEEVAEVLADAHRRGLHRGFPEA